MSWRWARGAYRVDASGGGRATAGLRAVPGLGTRADPVGIRDGEAVGVKLRRELMGTGGEGAFPMRTGPLPGVVASIGTVGVHMRRGYRA